MVIGDCVASGCSPPAVDEGEMSSVENVPFLWDVGNNVEGGKQSGAKGLSFSRRSPDRRLCLLQGCSSYRTEYYTQG
jgi:hypothetical protein